MKSFGIREIPKKNYIILGIVIFVTLLILYYFYLWAQAYKETKLNIRIMDNYMEVINYTELDNYLVESPDTIIYVSVLEDSAIRSFEKKFKNLIKNNELSNTVLYMDVTNDLYNNSLNQMFKKYNLNNIDIGSIPLILVMDNGNIDSVYNIRENDYDIDGLKDFINSVRYNSGDDING